MTVLIDGTGSGNQARVDAENRLRAHVICVDQTAHRAREQKAFNLNTGTVTLTSANESAVMYLYNNENIAFHVTNVAVGIGLSTGGAAGEPASIILSSDVSGGTIISDATNVDINRNRFVGSSTTFDGNVYKGGEGKTATGGDDAALFFQTVSGRLFASFSWYIPKGKAVAVKITPPSGNTNMVCYAALVGHVAEED